MTFLLLCVKNYLKRSNIHDLTVSVGQEQGVAQPAPPAREIRKLQPRSQAGLIHLEVQLGKGSASKLTPVVLGRIPFSHRMLNRGPLFFPGR